MDPISSTSRVSTSSAISAASANSAGASGQGSFAAVLQQIKQSLPADSPPSAYTPQSGSYSLESRGSHIVNGVQLIPGAPGYRQDLAAPWLEQIAASQAALAAMNNTVAISTPLPAMSLPTPAVEAAATLPSPAPQSVSNTDSSESTSDKVSALAPPVEAKAETVAATDGSGSSGDGQSTLDALVQSVTTQNESTTANNSTLAMLLDQLDGSNGANAGQS